MVLRLSIVDTVTRPTFDEVFLREMPFAPVELD